jgi:hypothetical protein
VHLETTNLEAILVNQNQVTVVQKDTEIDK